jgi:hypothetical protein
MSHSGGGEVFLHGGGIRELADEQFSRLLVTTNFSESDGTRTITMGLLDTTGGLEEES